MSDLQIIDLYNKGFSIYDIAKRYRRYEKIVFKKTITHFQAQQIISYIIYTYNKSVYGNSRRLQF